MFGRIIATIGLFIGSTVFGYVVGPWATIAAGQLGGTQFAASNGAAVSYVYGIAGLSTVYTVGSLLFLGLFVLIWWKPLKSAVSGIIKGLIAALFLAIALTTFSPNANAYYDKSDWPEVYPILPNWSAFWIPDTGDNKNGQTQFDSADYLNANKVPFKRFQVPHVKLPGSAYFSDFYVPGGRLILVDRTTFSHEWVDNVARGDNAKADGFPCQSNDGVNISAGVSVGARVDEKDAATFLYNFGVKSDTDLKINNGDSQHTSDPQVVFKAVYYGRSLRDVMADLGRKKIQTLVCNEIGARDFDTANKDYVKIMDAVAAKADVYFKSVGITISFIGWADTFGFDHEVQAAVNRRYVANIEAINAAKLEKFAEIIKTLAAADALRNFGAKSDGKFPTTVVGSVPSLDTMFGSFLGSNVKSIAATPTVGK